MTITAGPIVPPLRASLLGPVRLAVGDRVLPADAWSRRSARALLLLLLISPGHHLPRERILDRLWPSASPEAGDAALSKAVHALRRVLEPGLSNGRASRYVEAAAEKIALYPIPGLWLDVDAFEAALAAAAVPSAARGARLREALTLYRGHLLDSEPAADWMETRREELRTARRQAVLALTALEFDRIDPATSLPALESLLVDDPTDEAALQALLRALVADGQRELALRRYEQAIATLRAELDVEPSPETRALVGEIRTATSIPVVRSWLPRRSAPDRFEVLPSPPNPLIGRERELEAILDLLWQEKTRIITLTGPGGIGKTRLAIDVAAQAAPDFAAGVCFVPLSTVRDHRLVLPAIARALGIDEIPGRPAGESLRAALRDQALLLVLDNCEQVIEAAPAIAELLDGCSRLKILATSREPLHLRAEHQFPTLPLALPHPQCRTNVDALARYEAIALFIDRARAVKPNFALTEANAPAVAEICTRLDGLPLAIELAAARAKVLPPETLSLWMGQRLSVLTEGPRDLPERLRTMRDAIAWSYVLLTPPEQALFRRLSIFVGGFTLEAAEAVGGRAGGREGGDDASSPSRLPALDALASLVDKSLVQREDGPGEVRFRQLETIREFGGERLDAEGEFDSTCRAHAAYFLALAERAEPELVGSAQGAWLDQLEIDHDNLRAVLRWAIERDQAEIALRLSGALWRFWMVRGHLGEGAAWLEAALTLPGGAGRTAARAKALTHASDLARRHGDDALARDHRAESLSIRRELGDAAGLAADLTELGRMALAAGDYAAARQHLEEALAMQQERGDESWIGRSLLVLGRLAYHEGNPAEARRLAARSLDVHRHVGDEIAIIWSLQSLAHAAIGQRDLDAARVAVEEALTVAANLGYSWGVAAMLDAAAALAAATGAAARALRLAAAAEAIREPLGIQLAPDWRADVDHLLAPARRAFTEADAATERAAGRALTTRQAIAEALTLARI